MSDEIDKVVEGFVDDLRIKVREMTVRLLGPGRTPDNVLALARNVVGIFDVTEAAMSQMFPPETPVACRKECTFCCHLLFFTDAPTVFLVADEVSRELAPAAVDDLIRRLADFEEMDFGLRMVPRPPCPLLMDRLCQAYDVRPLVCRSQNSLDVSQCEDKYNGQRRLVVAHDIPLNVWSAVSEGLSAGLAEAGFAADAGLEFTTALRIALETPGALQSWLAGEPVFATARPEEDTGSGSVH